MFQFSSWATREWSLRIWICPDAWLDGNREPGSVYVQEEDRDPEQKGALGPDLHLGKGEKQHLFFHPFPLVHAPGQQPEANSDSWQSSAWTTVRKPCTQLLFQRWCDRLGHPHAFYPVSADRHLWANGSGQLEVMGGDTVTHGYGVTAFLPVKRTHLWRDPSQDLAFPSVWLESSYSISLSLYPDHKMMVNNCSYRSCHELNEITHAVCAKALGK